MLDSVSAGAGKEFKYFYTLVNQAKEEIDTLSAKQFLTAQIIDNIKSNEQMRFMREAEVTMIYRYYDRNSDFVFEIRAAKNDYE